MSQLRMTIDGQAVIGSRFYPVINPASGTPFAQAPDCTLEELELAIAAAASAFQTWRRDEKARRQALRNCAHTIRTHIHELAELLTLEQGKPLQASKGEAEWLAYEFEYYGDHAIPCEILQDDDEVRVEVRRKPHGVVVAITPWNYPLTMAALKVPPALLVGNTVVLKPSPFTPLATLRLGELLQQALPPGVLNVVSGGAELGAAMTAHPTVRKITFTGSVATGKKVAQAAAPDLKHLTLELGGNDPAIVLPDIEPNRVAEKIFWSAFENSGQRCMAIKRVYAHEAIYRDVVTVLAEYARHAKMGDGMEPGTELGPVNNRSQFERVIELVEDARQAGARMATGGYPRLGPGYFVEPTIVSDITDGTRLVDEEQFGPVLPVIPYRNIDDALKWANATHYGLGGSVWTSDIERGTALASELECGTSWVNQHSYLTIDVPFGGAKWSGIGHELGRQGLDGYSQLQVIRTAKR